MFVGAALAGARDFEPAVEHLNAAMRLTNEHLGVTPGSRFWMASRSMRAHRAHGDPLAAAGQMEPLSEFLDPQWELLSQSPKRASSESMRALVMLADSVDLANEHAAMSAHLMGVLQQRIEEDRVPRWTAVRCAVQMIECMREHGEGAAAARMAQTVRSWLERSGMGQSSWAKTIDAVEAGPVAVGDGAG